MYDKEHFNELFPEVKRVYDAPRVQHRIPVGDNFINCDVRYVGDGYYPTSFEREILETRIRHPKGFFVPDLQRFTIALAYHAVHHKNANRYRDHLGDNTIDELLVALKESQVGWCQPDDYTVGRYHGYMLGSTSTASRKDGNIHKTQTMFFDFDLIQNEARVLKLLDSKHFPKLISHSEGTIVIEDCGERLNITNLPEDWGVQLMNIVDELDKYGVVHRDIRPQNLLVKNDVIKLIDFGWARLKDEDDNDVPSPEGLGSTKKSDINIWYKPTYGFDDKFSMKKVIKELEFRMED